MRYRGLKTIIMTGLILALVSGCSGLPQPGQAPQADGSEITASSNEMTASAQETVTDAGNSTVSEDGTENSSNDLPDKDPYYAEEFPTYHFFKVDEVIENRDPDCYIEASENGYIAKKLHIEHAGYIKVKGTLYELTKNGEPCYDKLYYPDEELPEGYEVKTTEDYEFVMADEWDITKYENETKYTSKEKADKIIQEFDYKELYNNSINLFMCVPDENGKQTGIYILNTPWGAGDWALTPGGGIYGAHMVKYPIEPGMYGALGDCWEFKTYSHDKWDKDFDPDAQPESDGLYRTRVMFMLLKPDDKPVEYWWDKADPDPYTARARIVIDPTMDDYMSEEGKKEAEEFGRKIEPWPLEENIVTVHRPRDGYGYPELTWK